MTRVSLNILQPNLPEQRYSCHACGNCCQDFTVQLREDDLDKLNFQKWEAKLGFSPVVEFRGSMFLRQRDDGGCIFWMEDGRCQIHAEFSFEEKPIACQLFPFSMTPVAGGAALGVNFACQSVLESKGAELRTHGHELARMAKSLPEVSPLEQPPMLTTKLRASHREVSALTSRIDVWLRRDDIHLSTKLDGLAWVTDSLGRATLENVRDKRFADLLDALFGALPQELEFLPVEDASRGQRKMLRQAAYARVEDPKVGRVQKLGKARTAIGQFLKSRRFASGKGVIKSIGRGWPEEVQLQHIEQVLPAGNPQDIEAIEELITRWLRATILGGRCWGAGYYGWPLVQGLQAMMLNVAIVGWLARLHASGNAANGEMGIENVRAAVGRVDRTSGRAKWLGSKAELWRLKYFGTDDGLRRLLQQHTMICKQEHDQ